jgi:hypothetical protein
MAAKKKTARGRKQDRARVAKGQDYEVRYEAKKTGRSASAVKKAVKKVGNSRKRVVSAAEGQVRREFGITFGGHQILPEKRVKAVSVCSRGSTSRR